MRDIIQRQSKNPSIWFIWVVSLYLFFLKQQRRRTMFPSTKKEIINNQAENSINQAKMGTACAVAIIGNILLHLGLPIAGFIFIGSGLLLVLHRVYRCAIKTDNLLPGITYASR